MRFLIKTKFNALTCKFIHQIADSVYRDCRFLFPVENINISKLKYKNISHVQILKVLSIKVICQMVLIRNKTVQFNQVLTTPTLQFVNQSIQLSSLSTSEQQIHTFLLISFLIFSFHCFLLPVVSSEFQLQIGIYNQTGELAWTAEYISIITVFTTPYQSFQMDCGETLYLSLFSNSLSNSFSWDLSVLTNMNSFLLQERAGSPGWVWTHAWLTTIESLVQLS